MSPVLKPYLILCRFILRVRSGHWCRPHLSSQQKRLVSPPRRNEFLSRWESAGFYSFGFSFLAEADTDPRFANFPGSNSFESANLQRNTGRGVGEGPFVATICRTRRRND